MKNFIFIFVGLFLFTVACKNEHQCDKKHDCEKKCETPCSHDSMTTCAYDSALAKELGADEYGMKQYFMVFLKRGPKRDQDSVTIEEIQKGHMENIQKLAADGKLVVAGPFNDDGDVRGIFILNAASMQEAEAMVNEDPAVKSGRLVMEIHPWYGSAALMQVNKFHETIALKNP